MYEGGYDRHARVNSSGDSRVKIVPGHHPQEQSSTRARRRHGWSFLVGLTVLTILGLTGLLYWSCWLMDRRENLLFRESIGEARRRLIREELRAAIGGDLELTSVERAANDIVSGFKYEEIEKGFTEPLDFLPAQNFLLASENIRHSKVFEIIRQMPKGAALHCHDTAMTSLDYVLYNITTRPNLYICQDNDELKLQFFNVPDRHCRWKLLSEIRKTDSTINRRIEAHITLVTKHPDTDYPNVDVAWKAFMDRFIFIAPMLTYKPVYEDYYYQALKELYEDNVMYVEFRSILPELYDLEGNTYGPLDVARLYKNVTDRFVNDYPDFIGAKLIYAPLRKVDNAKLTEYLAIARQIKHELTDFMAGFDLVGQEDKGEPLIKFADQLHALDGEMNLYFHAGETNWYGTSADENLIDAVLLNVKRIGHGYALLKHPKILDIVKKNEIGIEVNPISNQVLKLVEDLRNHPASILFAGDYPVVISNDDPGLWNAKGLSYDFYEAFVGMMSKHADIRALKKLAMNSIKYSSLSKQEKSDFMEKWQKKWDSFIEKLVKA